MLERLKACNLLQSREIDQSQKLLHRVYCKEMGWVPDASNPSHLRTEGEADSARLVDRFESVAVRFGVFDGTDLVACIRVLKPYEGRLEFERYTSLPPFANQGAQGNREINRLAVLKEYRQTLAPVLLIREVAKWLMSESPNCVFVAASYPEPSRLCTSLGFEKLSSRTFKYHELDPAPVDLHCLDAKSPGALEQLLAKCERILE